MKFNTQAQNTQRTLNLAGGEAIVQSPKMELLSILLTSFVEDQFYRKSDQTLVRLRELMHVIGDHKFVAKAAVYARTQAGMRSITHVVAADLAKSVKGADWTKDFFARVVHRPDDVLEILARYVAEHKKPLPNSLKKGLGRALARFDAYQLAKYRGETRALKLVDAVNLLHPPHTEALGALVNGTLKPAETWETKLTQAGQEAKTEHAKAAKKSQAWAELIESRKIGYFALLRNLRNILEQAPKLVDPVCKLLTDEKLIRRSLVLPFRFRTAIDAIQSKTLTNQQKIFRALNQAVDTSLRNVPRFAGRTLIAVDSSASMIGRPMKIASLFAAVLYKSNCLDLMLFSSDAKYVMMNCDDSTLTIAKRIEDKAQCGGTNFHAIFQNADRAYARVIILSDMQGWMGYHAPKDSFNAYVRAQGGHRPRVFSFDLAGHGTLQFPETGVYCLAGFSDKTMDTLRFLEEDKTTLLKEIEAIEF